MFSKTKRNPLVYLILTTWECAKGHRGTVVVYLGMSFVAMMVWMTMPLILAELMNRVQSVHGEALIHLRNTLPANSASPLRQAMRSASSGGSSASHARDQFACSTM